MMYSAKLFTLPLRLASCASVPTRASFGDCGSAAGVASAIFFAMSTLGFCAIPAVLRHSTHAVRKMMFFILCVRFASDERHQLYDGSPVLSRIWIADKCVG